MVSVSLVRGSASACAAWSPAHLTAKLLPPNARRRARPARRRLRRPGRGRVAGRGLARRTPLAAAAAAMAAAVGLLPLAAIRWLPAGARQPVPARTGRPASARVPPRLQVDGGRAPAAAADLAAAPSRPACSTRSCRSRGIPSNLASPPCSCRRSRHAQPLAGWPHGDSTSRPAAHPGSPWRRSAWRDDRARSPVCSSRAWCCSAPGWGDRDATFALLIEQLLSQGQRVVEPRYDAGYGAGPAVFGLICVRTATRGVRPYRRVDPRAVRPRCAAEGHGCASTPLQRRSSRSRLERGQGLS